MNHTLTAQHRSELAAQLRQRLQQLERQISMQRTGQSRVEYAAELLNQDGDDATQRDADREVALERADHELQELGWVSRALARIHQPDYGLCEDCGEAVALARLRLEPWALRCVACESAHEGRPAAPHRL
jgi:DnaK suppressor protein